MESQLPCVFIFIRNNLSQSSHKKFSQPTFSTNFQLFINNKFKFKLATFSLASHLFNCCNCNLLSFKLQWQGHTPKVLRYYMIYASHNAFFCITTFYYLTIYTCILHYVILATIRVSTKVIVA